MSDDDPIVSNSPIDGFTAEGHNFIRIEQDAPLFPMTIKIHIEGKVETEVKLHIDGSWEGDRDQFNTALSLMTRNGDGHLGIQIWMLSRIINSEGIDETPGVGSMELDREYYIPDADHE